MTENVACAMMGDLDSSFTRLCKYLTLVNSSILETTMVNLHGGSYQGAHCLHYQRSSGRG